MTEITETTELYDVLILDYDETGIIPARCIAEVFFHTETHYVQFDYRELIYGMGPVPEYEVEVHEGQELQSSFKEWLSKNAETFWTAVYNDETFHKYH